MSVNEDWDVEQHKVEYESDEHWELRRKFLLAHKDKFSEDVLVCLAQVFVNVELLGCRYPQETMDLVKELSQDVAAEYREKQKKKLQRTFVEASQAASSKVKGCAAKTSTVTERSVPNTPNHIPNTANHMDQSCKNHHSKKNEKLEVKKALLPTPIIESVSNAISHDYQPWKNPDIEERLSKRLKTEKDVSLKDKDLCRDIVLLERPGDNVHTILDVSASVSGVALSYNYSRKEGGWECSLHIVKSEQLGCSINTNKKVAKKEAATIALEKLQKRCYTVKIKQDSDSKSDVTVTTEEIKPQDFTPNDDWKVSNCVGKKLMKMMGWTGGGLGKSEQGIVEPMSATVKTQINREGLGLKTNSYKAHEVKAKCREDLGLKTNSYKADEVKAKCRKLFKDLLQTDNCLKNDIVFLDFPKEDRMLIHQVARTMGLKSRSYGKGQRKLIVSRKVDIWNLVRELNSLGGVTEKYELIKPTDEKVVSLPTSMDI